MRRGLVLRADLWPAWQLGVLRGLQDVDVDLLAKVIAANVLVGTSAGSTVAAQITTGAALVTLYAAQLSEASAGIEVAVDMRALRQSRRDPCVGHRPSASDRCTGPRHTDDCR